tara:strand:+ start:1 stop:912 length:912 start_codon:yes stop_codon:yes gene_type:complete
MARQSYFQMFPTIDYDQDGLGDSKVVVDVMKRVRVVANQLSDKTLFHGYNMKDSERIEDISNKFYGSPKFHWVLLLINSVQDPVYQTALTSEQFLSYLESKYGKGEKKVQVTSIKIYDGNADMRGNVISKFDGTTYTTKFTSIESISNKVFVGDTLSLSIPYSWYTDVTGNNDPKFVPGVQKVPYGASQTVVSVDSDTEFETDLNSSTFNTFNANTDPSVGESVTALFNVYQFERDRKGPAGDVIYTKSITDIRDYDNPAISVTAVNRYDYENELNDSRRAILVLRPELLDSFVEEFKGLMAL